MKNKEKILLTGATGFVGKHLTNALLKDGYKIKALIRENSNTEDLDKKSLSLVCGDIKDKTSLCEATKDTDIVIHAAALMANYEHLAKEEFYQVNVTGTQNLLNASMKNDIKHFIHISTVGVLGSTGGNIGSEKSSYGSHLSKYEWSKQKAEKIVLNFGSSNNFPITILRPTQLYGPGMKHGWLDISRLILKGKFKVIGKGDSRLHLTYIDDFVHAILLIIGKEKAFGKTYIVGGDDIRTLREIYKIIADTLKVKEPSALPYPMVYLAASFLDLIPENLKPENLRLLTRHRVRFYNEDHVFDTSKIRKDFDYRPNTDLSTGFKNTCDWFRQKGYLKGN